MTAKADLHVHSKYSDHPSTWGHKVYNSPESFTDIETVYYQAKQRGMDFVTLTDHDDIRGSLELTRKFPNDTFMSCEVTTFFPEDDCKAHVLVYGLSEHQYHHIMRIRFDIYQLRDYLSNQQLAYSVAHATYDQDGKLSFKHIEKLVVLFDVFEVINGASNRQNNQLLLQYIRRLDQDLLERLQREHNIQPISTDPWVKGFTGGSDDHCGILIGTAFTKAQATDPQEFLNSIRSKKSLGAGLHGSFEIYATGVIKHVHDYRLNRDSKYSNTKMNDFFELFFNGGEGNLMKRFKKSQSLRYLKKKNNKTHSALHALLQQISEDAHEDIAEKIPAAYAHITELHDEMFRSIVIALSKHLPSGDIFKGIQKLAAVFPMTLLAAPFVGSMRHQILKADIRRKLINNAHVAHTSKTLWFTDTIDDLNGVSVTLRQIAKQSALHGYQLTLVTCVDPSTLSNALPTNTINFPPIQEVNIPGYEQQTVGFPSLLSMMRTIANEQADQIIISTPGPLGLGGLLCAKLMDIPVKMVYHTDFAEQIVRMTHEPMLAHLTDQVVNAFYQQADQVFVPSHTYIDKLTLAGLDHKKLGIFPRGLDLNLYKPNTTTSNLKGLKQLHGDFTLLFAGRLSEDKNLSLLIKIAKKLDQQHRGDFNVVIAGDGPDFQNTRLALSGIKNVYLTGRIGSEELVDWYRSADLFVFPSHTDTFGMVVLEAQACGTPCLVTNSGGPKEIIRPGDTGLVMTTDDPNQWITAIQYYRTLKLEQPSAFSDIRRRCHSLVNKENNWQTVFDQVLGADCRLSSPTNQVNYDTPEQPQAA